jgi:uncharacterized protein (DUF1778 family)
VILIAWGIGILWPQERRKPLESLLLFIMTFNVATFNGKPADISRIASIAAKPETPDMLNLQEYKQIILSGNFNTIPDPETYARFLAQLDMQPSPSERLRKKMQTPAPWEKA